MQKAFSNVIFVLFISILFQSSIFAQENIIVAEFDGKEITLSEFEKEYKNNFGQQDQQLDPAMDEMKKFLDLYVLFRMKIAEAEDRGYDELPALEQELEDYRKKVGTAYYIEKKLVEPRVKEIYERRDLEYLLAHIMISFTDTTEAYAKNKAHELIERLQQGEDFAELAAEYSADISTKDKGGVVTYFTAGQLFKRYEDAMAETEAGGVYPEPIRSNQGYHIIKILDKIKRIPEVKASHILIGLRNEAGEIDTANAKALADSIKTLIDEGADFEEMAKKFSDDPGSAEKGGELGFFHRRAMVPEFSDAAFSLEIGEVSEPVLTKFGYHIIKVSEHTELPSFEEEKEFLTDTYRKSFLKDEKKELIQDFKKRKKYHLNNVLLLEIAQFNDTIRVNEFFDVEKPDNMGSKKIFSIGELEITIDSLMKRAIAKTEFASKVVTVKTMEAIADAISDEMALEMIAAEMEKNDPAYAELMNEYKEGIFIFRLQEEEVWNRVKIDSAALYELWEETKEDYRWGDRVHFIEIFKKDSAGIASMMDSLEAGVPFDTLAKKYTQRPPKIRIAGGDYGFRPVDDNKMTEKAWTLEEPGDISEIFPVKGGYSVVKLVEKDPARLKTFEEARAEVSGIYQEQESKRLEQQFEEYLYDKYEPEFYYENLEEAFKN